MKEQELLARYTISQVFRGEGAVRSYKGTAQDGRTVVLKIVDADPSEAIAAVERLGALASLEHANVARVLDRTVLENGYAVVREWVEGVSLDVRPLPEGTTTQGVADWVAQAADGLAAVHSRGLVHGDIRPSNLVLDPKGHVKVVDAGIPPATPRLPMASASPDAAYYSSPEEVAGQPPTGATDIYRLGIVLYELETGRVPFDGPDVAAVIEAQRSATPPLMSSANPAVPVALDGVAATAMEKLPHSRYGSAAAMAAALRAAVGTAQGGGRPWWLWLLVAAVVVLAVVVAWLIARSDNVAVPDLVGKTQTEAQATLEGAGLELGEVTQEDAADVEPGLVLSQDPAAGEEAKSGSKVDIVISAVPSVAVPDVVGLDQEAAIAALQEAGLEPGRITTTESTEVPPGTVVDQAPKAGESVPQGTPVDLMVAALTQVDVPDVVNKTIEEATAALEAVGLAVGEVTEETSDRVAPGLVTRQDPRAGSTVDAGAAVDLVVATAPALQVPNVTGQAATDAATALLQAGLIVGRVDYASDELVQAGFVLSQDPAAGAEAQAGSAVNLVISKGSQNGQVPDVVGLTVLDAVEALTAAGFAPTPTYQSSDSAPPGQVLAQDPAGGTSAPGGTNVSITVSSGPEGTTAVVPDMVGQNVVDAILALGQANLTPEFEFVQDEQNLVVLAQDPSGGTEVDPGTPVLLTVGVSAP